MMSFVLKKKKWLELNRKKITPVSEKEIITFTKKKISKRDHVRFRRRFISFFIIILFGTDVI